MLDKNQEITQESLNEMFSQIGIDDTDEILKELIDLHIEIENLNIILDKKSERYEALKETIKSYWLLNQITQVEKAGYNIELKTIESFSVNKGDVEKIRPLLEEIGQGDVIVEEPSVNFQTFQAIMRRLTNKDDTTFMIHYDVEELKKNYPINYYSGNKIDIKKSKKSKK